MRAMTGWMLAAALTALATGCGYEGDEAEGEYAQTDDALKPGKDGNYHYAPSIQDVRWAAGCGRPLPGQPPCYAGVVLTYTRNWGDLQSNITTHVDTYHRTLIITVDTFSKGQIHSMMAVRPQDAQLGTLGLQMGKDYTVRVKDFAGKQLYTGKLRPMLGM